MGNKKNKNKKYIQAVKYYEQGQIDKSLKKCEESIAEDLKNSSTLNLKGLLLYLKGDLRGAVATWKINADFNNDDIAKNYIQDSKKDQEKIRIYKEAEVFLARQNINNAIENLKLCKESDFNAIKVNLNLAMCYLKKGEYEYSAAHLTRVLSMDKNNDSAKKIAKEIQKMSGTKLQVLSVAPMSASVIIKAAAFCLIIAALIFGIYKVMPIFTKGSNSSNVNENALTNNIDEKENDNEDENNLDQGEKTKDDNVVDCDKVQKLIDSKNYDEVFDSLKDIDIQKLQGKQLAVCKLGQELLENEGAEYFYNKAMSAYKSSDYKSALTELEKAYKYSSKTYLASEILFFDAAVNNKNKNSERAINLYEEYYKKYKHGDYLNETLYNLAMLYKGQDLDKAKTYAKELNEKHSESMYNNENIKSLLNN